MHQTGLLAAPIQTDSVSPACRGANSDRLLD
jgi:hypothetical protein